MNEPSGPAARQPASNPTDSNTATKRGASPMAAADNLNTARKYGAAHGFASANGRAIIDADGKGVAPSWKVFARINAAAIDAWAAEQPARSTGNGNGPAREGVRRNHPDYEPRTLGTILVSNYNGIRRTCVVTMLDGALTFILDDGRTFASSRQAGLAVKNAVKPANKCNGWTFWKDESTATFRQPKASKAPAAPKLYHFSCACDAGFDAPRLAKGQPRCPTCDERGTRTSLIAINDGPETIDASARSTVITREEEEQMDRQEREEQETIAVEQPAACTCNVPPMSPGGEFDADEPCPLHPRSLDTADDAAADEWPPVEVEPVEKPAKVRKARAPRTSKKFDTVPETDEVAALQQTVAISAADQKAEQKRLKKLSAQPKLGRLGRKAHAAAVVAASTTPSLDETRAIIAAAS